jgi:hypothetical protein
MERRDFLYTLAAGLPALTALDARALARANNSKIVYPGKNGKLVYVPDEKGNVIPDFSNCGYGGGGIALPDVPVKETLSPAEGDSAVRIQAAIDRVSKMLVDRNGFRGTVLLKRGTYRLSDSIRINESGIVLRGEGDSEKGTVLIAAKREKSHKLIEIRGKSAAKAMGSPRRIVDEYVPVGTHGFRVDSTSRLKPGDKIIVRRIGNKDWISHIKMDQLPPRQGASTIQWSPLESDYERIITSIEGDRITIDAPIVCAIERKWGGGAVYTLDDSQRIRNIGVEHLRGVSQFDPKVTEVYGKEKKVSHSDEKHAWDFIYINFAENVWVRNISALHFAYSAVNIGKAKWVTVQDSKCLEMVSRIWGGRRYSFNVDGQLCLVQRCEASTGRHDFVVGAWVCGPNAFVHCRATETYASSEPHHRWSTGGLFDNVKAPLAFQDRQNYGTGHGWSGANYVAWNCEGDFINQRPPTAQNWVIGHVGEKRPGDFLPREEGYLESYGRHVEPQSLYLKQIEDRLGKSAAKSVGY